MSIARGILKGFISQGIDTKVAEDKRLADLTDRISETYLNVTLPSFLEKENEMKNRYDTIKAKDETLAKFGLAKNLYSTDDGYKILQDADQTYIDRIKSADINFGDFNFGSGAITRSMNFNERNKKTIDSLVNQQGGIGKSTAGFMVKAPVPEGVQPSTFDASTVPSMSELGLLESTGADGFAAKPQFRLRLNDTVQSAFSNVGLDGQFYMKEGNLITQFDEATRNKGILTQELVTQRFTPKVAANAGYSQVATQVANEVKALETSTSKFKTDTDNLFTSKNYSSGSIGANDDKTYEQFIIANQGILSAYGKGSIAYKRFIREKFNALTPSDQGYYEFFERFDKEVDTEDS
tara:strand:- start:416 stop:1468 length:1053 start_codon:yes stop_codon:yes gene_type:complete